MKVNTTNLPVNISGEILREHYLANKAKFVSTPNAFSLMPNWVLARCHSLMDNSLHFHGFVGPDLVVIEQYDGDTLTIIWDAADKVLYWNTDSKKAYGWQRQKAEIPV